MSTPPEQPGDANTPKANPPIEEQLDDLLSRIESAEPGTLDPNVLPQTQDAAEATNDEIQDLLNAPPTQAEIDALLNAPPAITEAPAEPEPPPPAAETTSTEEQLQQEIAALMASAPEVEAPPQSPPAEPASVAAAVIDDEDDLDILEGSFVSPEQLATIEQAAPPAAPPADAPSTEDQIAMEIEGLLAAEEQPAATATADAEEAAINELDQMLAQEIDEDDELAGEFQSVEDLTAGIQVDDPTGATDDEHAATARDVAAELDSQPEDLPAPPPVAQPVAAETTSQPDSMPDKAQALFEHDGPGWQRWLELGKQHLLNACYLINWPARRFLTAEWRANLGYIALLNLFFGVGFWVVMILF